MNIESKLVGELGASNAQFSFIDEEVPETTVHEEDDIIIDPEEEDEEELEEEIIEDDDIVETPDGDYDDDLSEGAILASIWKKEGVIPEDVEIPKNVSIKELKEKIQDLWMEESRSQFDDEIQKLGFTPEMRKYVEDIMSGVEPGTLSVATEYDKMASLPVSGDDDNSARNREFLILEMYKAKGLTPAKAKRLYESAVDNGDEDEEALEAQSYFAEESARIKQEEVAERQKAEKRELEERESKVKKVKDVISSGNVAGIKISKIEAENLKKTLFDVTETIELENGKKAKVTKFQKLMQDYNNNVEHQVLFAYLVANNFNLSSLKQAAKVEASDDLFNFLGGKVTKRKKAYEGFSSQYKGEI